MWGSDASSSDGKSLYSQNATRWRRVMEGKHVAKCPKCGSEGSLRKKWKMAGRPDKTGKKMELEIGLFDCKKCDKAFRVVLNKRKI